MSVRRVPTIEVTIAAALATVACVKVPEFQFRDSGAAFTDDAADDAASGSSGAIAYVDNDGHHVGELPGIYRMDFSNLGFHFPYQFSIGGSQLFTTVDSSPGACNIETGVGVAYYPAKMFTSIDTLGATRSSGVIKVDVPGPGIAKIGLDWSASFTASGCTGQPNGRTTFTFFPDGRITRMDAARLPTAVDPGTCRCSGGATTWELFTYYTFNDGVIDEEQGVAVPLPSAIGENATPQSTVCLEGFGNAFQLGMGWRAQSFTRFRRITAGSYAAIADMMQPTMATIGNSSFLVDTITTMIASRDSTCSDIRDRVQPYTMDPQLQFDNGTETVAVGLGQDGMYGGETSQATPGRDPGGPIVTLRADSVPLGAFAVWLDFGNYDTIASVVRAPASTRSEWYTVQQVPGTNHFIFWFPDGLAGSDQIRIEAK